MVRDLAAGARVLDVFSCTGGFTVHAAAGGARSVHSVDASRHAIAAVERHLQLNRANSAVAAAHTTGQVGDAFAVLAELAERGRRYDLVIVDPPSFASKQADVDGARRAYGRLTRLAVDVLEPGGTLVQSSCSSRVAAELFEATVLDAAASAGRPLGTLRRTGHAVDHPIGFPQGAYLKTVVGRC
jgi:23S rRNA (cytosine1962-C5)-methyltransferase